MACSMQEIEAFLPQVLTGKHVDCKAAGALGEDRGVNPNKTLEDQSERPLLKLGGLAKVESSGGISGAIQVLAARITKIDRSGVNDRATALLRLVVDHGTVGAGGRDGIK